MDNKAAYYRGCLLGLAVGDAMGYTVDEKTWEEICADYGPNGLLGYDLVNGCADVSAYTQLAAYSVNGLLMAVTRGRQDAYLRFLTTALREWARGQHFPRDPERSYCWIAKLDIMRRKHCRDIRMLTALGMERLGTPEAPLNRNNAPGALTVAAMIGLAFDPKRMEPQQVGELAAKAVALTHGDPETFLSGVVLAYCIAGIVQEPSQPLKEQFLQAISAMDGQFRETFPQTADVAAKLKLAISMAERDPELAREGMEALECDTAVQCLGGAMYACLMCREDFDATVILAVNHSGRSAATGALTGAVLGAKLGAQALPEFYLEGLEVVGTLEELAGDLCQGSPIMGLFDDDWDQKYVQGMPL